MGKLEKRGPPPSNFAKIRKIDDAIRSRSRKFGRCASSWPSADQPCELRAANAEPRGLAADRGSKITGLPPLQRSSGAN
jgi:hypothetical protein